MVLVNEIVYADLNSYVYELITLLNTNSKVARFKIKNDIDVQYALGDADRISKVYVTIQHS